MLIWLIVLIQLDKFFNMHACINITPSNMLSLCLVNKEYIPREDLAKYIPFYSNGSCNVLAFSCGF